MLIGRFGVSLLGNMLAGKYVITAAEGSARVGYGCKTPSRNFFFDSTPSINKL